jgi:GT2 family glycosyltransferase
VLHWGSLDDTFASLDSLRAQTCPVDLLVVDNGTTPPEAGRLSRRYPDAAVRRLDDNRGVAGGRNVGLAEALRQGRRFVLLFDNDAVAAPDMVERLLDDAQSHPAAGLFGPKIRVAEDPSRLVRAGGGSWRVNYLSSVGEISRKIRPALPRAMQPAWDPSRGEGARDDGRYDAREQAGFVTGGAQLIRVSALREVGLLDERFSPYGCEDIDLCARLARAGWLIRYVGDAVCVHPGPGSYRQPWARAFYNTRNTLLLARKHLDVADLLLVYGPDLVAVTLPLKLAHAALAGSPEQVRGIVEAVVWNARDVAQNGLRVRDPVAGTHNGTATAAQRGEKK